MIKIIEDEEDTARSFQVYRSLPSHHSNLFKRLLAGPLKDSDTHSLRHEKVEAFQIFYDRIFSGELAAEGDAELTSKECVNVYVFVDTYMVQELKDNALSTYLLRLLKEWVVYHDVPSLIYKKTSRSSSLQKLHVNLVLETHDFKDFRS